MPVNDLEIILAWILRNLFKVSQNDSNDSKNDLGARITLNMFLKLTVKWSGVQHWLEWVSQNESNDSKMIWDPILA